MLSVVEWAGGEMVENFTVERGSSASPPPPTDVAQMANETEELASPTKKGGAYHTIDLVESSESDYDDTNTVTNIGISENNIGVSDANIPDDKTEISDVEIRMLEVKSETPDDNNKMPHSSIRIPDLNVGIPGANVGIPDTDILIRDANIGIPDGNIGMLDIKESGLEIDVVEANVGPAHSSSEIVEQDDEHLAEEVKLVVDEMLDFLERRETFPEFGYDLDGTIENEVFVKIEGTCGKPHCIKGCLCSSLRGAFPHGPTHPTHCGFEQCIFKCTCADRNCGALNEDGSRYHDKSKRKKKLPNRYKDTVLGRAYRKVHAKTIRDCEPLGNSSSNSEEEYRALSPPDTSKDSTGKPSFYPNAAEASVRERHSWLPADRGGFTASVKKTIQDRRFAFMRKTLTDEKQTLADVFVWCSQHNKYNCLCINYVYFAKTNTLLWRPSKKERYLAIKVMFEIMLTEPSEVVYEVFPYDTSRHTARTAGILFDYSARNKDELFLKKRKVEIENNILSYSNGYVKFKKYVIIKQPTPVQMATPWEEVSSLEKQESLAPVKNLHIVKTSEKMRVDVGEEDLESMVDYDLDEDDHRGDNDEAAAKREAEMKLSRRKRKMTMKMIQLEEERRREFFEFSDQEEMDEVEPPPLPPPPPPVVPVLKKKRGRKPKIRVMMEKAAAAAAVLASSFEVSPVPSIDIKPVEHDNVLNGDHDVRPDKLERRLSDSSSERPGLVVRRSSDNSEMRSKILEPVPEVQLISCNEVRRFERTNRLEKLPDVGPAIVEFGPKKTSEPLPESKATDFNNIRLKPSLERKHVTSELDLAKRKDGLKRMQKSNMEIIHKKLKMRQGRPRSIGESRRKSGQDGKMSNIGGEKKASNSEQKRFDVKREPASLEEAIVCAPDLPMRLNLPPSRPLKRKQSQDLGILQSPTKMSHRPSHSSTPRLKVTPVERPNPGEEDDNGNDDNEAIFTKEVRVLEPRADGYPHMGLTCLTPGFGYVEVHEVLHDRIVIEDPASPGLRHSFANLLAANAWLDGFFRGKATFHPPTLELRWILVTSDILKAKRMAKLDCRMFADPLLIITGQGPARAIPSLQAKSPRSPDYSLMRKMLSESPKSVPSPHLESHSKQLDFESYVENPKFGFVRRPTLALNPKFKNRLHIEMSPEFQSFDSPDGCVTVERIPGSLLPLNSSDESRTSTLASLLNAPKRSSLDLHVQLPEEPMDQAVIKPLPKLTSIRHLPTIPNGHCLTTLKTSENE